MTLGVVGSQYLYKYEKEIWQTFDYDGGYVRIWREWEAIPAVTFIRKHFINKSFPNQHCQAWSSPCNITKAIIRDRFYFVQMLKQTQAVYAPLPYTTKPPHTPSYSITIITKKNTTASLKITQMSQKIK